MSTVDYFSRSYAEARRKFLAAAMQRGLALSEYPHPERGREGEALAIDAALGGNAEAQDLLIISSACHGIEGYCGSGAQTALLHGPHWQALTESGCAILFVHGLNPHGFSWWRRVTHENIDLNRNCHDFSQALPRNPEYEQIADMLVPERWPPTPGNWLRLLGSILRLGWRGAQRAVSAGQFTHPQGLFYGGQSPSWSLTATKQILRKYGANRRRIAWIDIHSGLGPSGVGERIFTSAWHPDTVRRARNWWGEGVKSSDEGNSVSMVTGGQLWRSIYEVCPQAEYTGIAIEFGTLPPLKVLQALRGDQWLQLHPDAPAKQAQSIRQRLFEAFFTDTIAWKESVVAQTEAVVLEAIKGLASSR